MSQTLTVNGIEYIPAGAAGKHFGYTRDYMLILARDGKIDGQKIGHRWYIQVASAEKYFKEAHYAREERKQKISYERKEELRTHVHTKTRTHKNTKFLETVAILGIGLIVGITGYVGTNPGANNTAVAIDSNASFLKQLAASFFDLVSFRDTSIPEIESVSLSPAFEIKTESAEANNSLPVSNGTTTHTSLVIAPNQLLTTTTVESIRDSFSDDVSVSMDPQNPDTGIIIPHFKDKDGEAYRYLIVPVSEGNLVNN